MLNIKIMTLSSKFFICMFLYPLLSLNSMATIYKISSKAILKILDTEEKVESNSPEVIVKYENSSLEIKSYWEIVENGDVILFYDIKSLNWRKISDLSFQNDFNKKFDIVTENSYWISFNDSEKKYFQEDGVVMDDQVEISLKDNKLEFEAKKNSEISGNSLLAIYLKPNYEKFTGEVYKNQIQYNYKNDKGDAITKISYTPNFYFVDNKQSDITILRYQTVDINKDSQIDFPYQLEEFTVNVGDIVFYKVEIKNNMDESIYNLNIINPIGDYSKLAFGDRLLTGTGYPIVKLQDGKILEIKNYPTDSSGGKLEFFLEELKSKEEISIYYCVEIIRR